MGKPGQVTKDHEGNPFSLVSVLPGHYILNVPDASSLDFLRESGAHDGI